VSRFGQLCLRITYFPVAKKQFVFEKKCIVSSIFYENGNIFVNAVHITQAQPLKKKPLYYESEARKLLQLAMRELENFPFNWFTQLPLNLYIRFRYKSLQSATHKYVRSVYYELAQLVVHADPYKLVHPIFYKFMQSATCKTMQYYAYKLMSINLYSNYSPADKT